MSIQYWNSNIASCAPKLIVLLVAELFGRQVRNRASPQPELVEKDWLDGWIAESKNDEHMDVSTNRDTQNGWFIMETPI